MNSQKTHHYIFLMKFASGIKSSSSEQEIKSAATNRAINIFDSVNLIVIDYCYKGT